MPRRYYSSTAARTTLASGVNDSTTSFTVVAVSGWPSSFPYTLIIDQDTINEEVVNVTARTGTSLTVERGQDGTTAVSHSAGASVNHGVSARDFNEPNQFLNEGGTVTGQTVVSSSGSGTTLEVRNTGTGNSFVVEDSANPDSTPFVIDASGKVGIGTSSPSTASPDASLDVYRSTESNLLVRGDANTQVLVRRSSTDGSGANLHFDKARGTDASKSVVSSGDTIGRVNFRGYDGSAFQNAADIFVSVDGTPGASDMPGAMIFRTTPDGSATLTERMRITNAGNVGIGTSSPQGILHASTSQSVVYVDSFNDTAGSGSNIIVRRARGTSSSPSAVQSGDTLLRLDGRGYGATGFAAGSRCSIVLLANQNWTDSAQGTSITFQTTANDSTTVTERVRINSAGSVGIGTASPSQLLHVNGDSTTAIQIERSSSDATAPAIILRKNRGTSSSKTVLASGDQLGVINFYGYDGSAAYAGAQITAAAEDIPASGDAPTRLMFFTTPDNASTPSERMRITNAGQIVVGDGTAAAPVLTNSGDENTGMWFPAADTIAFSTAGVERLRIDSGGNVTGGLPSPNRNLLYNGAMQVSQRGTSATGVTGVGYYTADRWYINFNGSLGTWTQSVESDAPDGSGFAKSLKLLVTTAQASPAASAFVRLEQMLEGQDLQRIKKGTASANQLSMSFWVKSNVTGTYTINLIDSDNNRLVAATYSVSASATWERKSVTFPADTTGAIDNDNAVSMRIIFNFGGGTDTTSGTLQTAWGTNTAANRMPGQTNLAAATNNYWQVTGVQLETGNVATDFEFKSYGQELRECQRYYVRFVGTDTNDILSSLGWARATTDAHILFPLPVQMRVTPTAVESSTVELTDLVNEISVGTLTLNGASTPLMGQVNCATSGLTQYRPYVIRNDNNASGHVSFSAEL